MSPSQDFDRIDTLGLKTLIVKKIGDQQADIYFSSLTRFLSIKLAKHEFDRICIRTIGKENISLHNKFIRSILKNACHAKVPPPKIRKVGSGLSVKVANGYQRNCLQSIYGDAFAPSPRKGRSPTARDRKFRDRRSPLGPPLEKSQSVVDEDLAPRSQEQQSATELLSLGSRPPCEGASVEDGEEVEQMAGSPGVQSRNPVTAPLGISVNMVGARKALFNGSASNRPETCQNSGELPDSRSLRNRVERNLEKEGVSVSMDCVNLLNNAVDVYLKRLIEPCMKLAGSRTGNENSKQVSCQIMVGPDGMLRRRYVQRSIRSVQATALDFRVAMESYPQVLGEDWAIQLEKLCLHRYDE
ncbi:Transcriptional coactivator Hfi1/Transcriptional adapter 1 [Dillenia turbinata]|uniref:Transcriptional coactivator Hfi1/Transcriptional adapter 1 n=1 Tax=Dillenia turbinata TaxID=194707 RepID=A0AAN8ZT83_9MAGN